MPYFFSEIRQSCHCWKDLLKRQSYYQHGLLKTKARAMKSISVSAEKRRSASDVMDETSGWLLLGQLVAALDRTARAMPLTLCDLADYAHHDTDDLRVLHIDRFHSRVRGLQPNTLARLFGKPVLQRGLTILGLGNHHCIACPCACLPPCGALMCVPTHAVASTVDQRQR